MSTTAKAGDILLIGIVVPEECDGLTADDVFSQFCEEPHGWDKTLEGLKEVKP